MTRKIALTAHVLIGLKQCSEHLEGSLKVIAATAKTRSVKYDILRVLYFMSLVEILIVD